MRLITQKVASELLKKHGILYVSSVFLPKKDDIIKTKKLGFPLVVKPDSQKVVHKTDLDVVKTNIKNINELKENVKIVSNILEKNNVSAYELLIQKQIQGVELIIGIADDPQFGKLIMVGLGGIFVELFKDVSFRVAPISKKEAKKMLEETKAMTLLSGFRGDTKKDINKVCELIEKTSKMIIKEKNITELDFNPVIVTEKEAYVVDARIIMREK